MSKSLEQIMADMAAQGITISTNLHNPNADTPARRIRDASRAAGIAYDDEEADD
jgi:hypothetical protein